MEKTLLIFTISTLFLFTITTAVIASDPVTVADTDESDSIKTQTFIVKQPRFVFSRPHPVRHEIDRTNYNSQVSLRFVKRHPCRKFLKKTVMIPRSYGNDMIVDSKTVSFDTETIGNDKALVKFLEFKHGYGHRHHHHHEHLDDDDEHKEEKKRGYKGGFARQIRKFLKHTFD